MFSNKTIIFCVLLGISLKLVNLDALPVHTSFEGEKAPQIEIQDNEICIEAFDETIIHFSSFDIQKDDTVRIKMEDPSHSIIFMIDSEFASEIDGRLQSNGILYLINPKGLRLNSASTVNVDSLYLSTITKETDLRSVIKLIEEGGMEISTIHLSGSIWVKELTLNACRIEQFDGVVSTRESVWYNSIIFGIMCDRGTIKAKNIYLKGGKIELLSGLIDANSEEEGQTGGEILIEGTGITIIDSTIESCGPSGGGRILLGENSEKIFIKTKSMSVQNTEIFSCATSFGDGGKITFRSKDINNFTGEFFAKPGPLGGKDGIIETFFGGD